MQNMYYSLLKNESGKKATINIYGDITSWPWLESDVSAYQLSRVIDTLEDSVEEIEVRINSYGGEVAEGIAIYNALKRHKAKVTTVVDGFACSIASVIFMAGDERHMNESSILMIHDVWTYISGNAEALRKEADDLDKINELSVKAYMAYVNITEDELNQLMDDESFISPEEALEYGFASQIIKNKAEHVSQSARHIIMQKLRGEKKQQKKEPKKETEPESFWDKFKN